MTAPQERVEAYIRDWHQSWKDLDGSENSPATASADICAAFEKWRAAIRALESKHWGPEGGDQSGGCISGSPEHAPEEEKIRRHEVRGDTASVETEMKESSWPIFFEYQLKLVEGDWRITSVMRFLDDENATAFGDDDIRSLLEKASFAPRLPLHVKGDEPNCEALFEEGKLVKGSPMQKAEVIRVNKAGKLSLPSGVIVVRDFGYAPDDARPLSLKVKPGEYDVEACILEGCVAAVQVVFSRSKLLPFTYRQAVTVDGGDSIIGVDAGNVAICDAESYMKRTKRAHERDYQAWLKKTFARTREDDDITFMKLDGSESPTAIVCGSGRGDGGYPSYWMFDAQNNVVALVVDFQIAAEQIYRSVKIPWSSGCKGVIHQEEGLSVELARGSGVTIKGEQVSGIRWLDTAGTVVFDGNQLGYSSSSEGERAYRLDFTKLDGKASQMEITVHTGFRNNR